MQLNPQIANDFSDDSTLIEELKNGNAQAYSFLMDVYHQKLCVYAYGLTNDFDKAEDVVQNVLVRIWRKRQQLKSGFSLKSFLYKSVYNEFIDQYRKHKKVLALEKKHIDALTDFVENENIDDMNRLIAIVKMEIQNLPPKCRETFLLSKEEGLSNLEIADYLNVSIKSVEAHITKAFSILRLKIGNRTDGILFLLFGIHPTSNQNTSH